MLDADADADAEEGMVEMWMLGDEMENRRAAVWCRVQLSRGSSQLEIQVLTNVWISIRRLNCNFS